MTSSNHCMEAVLSIAHASGTNEKLAIMKEVLPSDELLQRVLAYTYSPMITFGVKSLPALPVNAGSKQFDDNTWRMLDMLNARSLTGRAALEAIKGEFARLSAPSALLLSRIIQRDLRAGIAHTSINKVVKGLIPVSPYMRCSLQADSNVQEWAWSEGVYSQLKADGLFVNIHRDGEGVWITSRSGQHFPSEPFSTIIDKLHGLDTFTVTHGEMLVVNVKTGETMPRKKGNGVINSVVQGGAWPEHHTPIIQVWDQIPIEAFAPKGSCITPYSARFDSLTRQLLCIGARSIRMVETEIVYSFAQAMTHYLEKLAEGLEGTIVKRRDMPWRDTGSSAEKGQVKLKVEFRCELRVTDFIPGSQKGKHAKTFGSLQCDSECGQLRVNVSGFTDKQRLEIHEDREGWLSSVISVVSNALLLSDTKKPHSLFLPRFDERRPDRTEADTFERIQSDYNSLIQLQSIAAEIEQPVARLRRITRTRRTK